MARPAAAIVLALGIAAPAQAAIITFDFTQPPYGVGTTDPRIFTVDGVTVTATALSHNGSFGAANLGKWNNGLAVCNAGEMVGGCQSGEHQTDNSGRFDFVLFEFSGSVAVIPLEARIRTTNGNDLDVTYWTGTGPTSLPASLAGTNSDFSGSSSSRTVSLSSGVADWLLFGARTETTSRNDGFKIKSLTVETQEQVPEPASVLLLAVGGLATAVARRRRGRD